MSKSRISYIVRKLGTGRYPLIRYTKRGFTLVEVMVATAILSLTTVLIYEAFFNSLDLFNHCSNYLNIVPWVDEKLWHAQDNLSRFGTLSHMPAGGDFVDRNKRFYWNLSYRLLDEEQGLYRIDVGLFWDRGRRRSRISRTAYAIYEEKE